MAKDLSNRYLIGDKIGGGVFSNVYKADDPSDNPKFSKTVAIKILNESLIKQEGIKGIKQFEREANISMQLNHENVVNVYEWGFFNGHHAIVMEYVEGKNLHEFMQELQKYKFEELIKIGYRIGKGIIAIHQKGIVHKDIKSENILISNDMSIVKIIDFGIAKIPKKWWQRDFFEKAGTERKYSHISYAAPEQKEGRSSTKSDIYSLGVIIDELLISKIDIPDIPGKNEQDYFKRLAEVVFKYKRSQPILSQNLFIPELCKEILTRATSDDPKERFETINEFVFQLSKFI